MNFKKISAYLILFRFIKIAFSIVTLILTAKFFGVSLEMDVWLIVSSAIATINLALWGPLNETFRAKFVFLKETDGEDSALFKVRSLLLFIIIITVIVSIFLALFSKSLIPFLAPSLENSEKEIFITILLFMIPSFVVNELTSIGTSILNAYDVFYMPEIMGIISAVINLLSIILLAPYLGIMSLIVGIYISIFILLVLIIYFLNKSNIPLLSGGVSLKWKYIKPFIYFSLPFFIPYFISQFQTILEKNLANNLGSGIVSIVNYSSQFKVIIQAVFTSVLITIMVPSLSMQFAKKNHIQFANVFKENVQIVFISLSLIVPFLFGAAEPIANILYNNGGIDSSSINEIVYLIRLYSISIISVMLYLIFGLTLLSQLQGVKYATQGAIAQVITIIANLLFYEKLGPTIFPLSLIISHFLVSLMMFKYLVLENKKIILLDISKYLLLILILSSILFTISSSIPLFIKSSLAQLITFGSILLLLLFMISRLLGFELPSYFTRLKEKI